MANLDLGKIKAAFNLVCFKLYSLVIQYVSKGSQLLLKKISYELQNCCLHGKRSKVTVRKGKNERGEKREKICLAMHAVNKRGSFTRYDLTEEWVVGEIHLHFRTSKNKFPLHWINIICFQRSMVHLIMPSRDNL